MVSLHINKKVSIKSIDRPEAEPDDPKLQFQRHMENKRGPIVFDKQLSKDKLIS